ncbi:MAG TPA: hypothetical protein VK654_17730 [Nitrospirota bacterium]|nr:hypothetical protein [Nitrospirota bacterium]
MNLENFADDEEPSCMADSPDGDVHIVKSPEKPGGIRKHALPPIAHAVAKAVFRITGAHVRELPMKPAVVLAAMKS